MSKPLRTRYVGKALRLVEARKLLTGKTTFVDDLQFAGSFHMGLVKSPYAHAKIRSINKANAIKAGAKGILIGEDVKRMTKPLWSGMSDINVRQYCLAVDRVLYGGEVVAAVAAEDRYSAEDLIEEIEVDYEPLPAAIDCERTLEDNSPVLHPEHGSNLARRKVFRYGDPERAFERSDIIVEDKFEFGRTAGSPLEPSGCTAVYDPINNSYRVWANLQGQNFNAIYASSLQIPINKFTTETPHQGGAFGAKFYSKYIIIACLLARETGHPIKFIETRTENHMTGDNHGPNSRVYGSLACDQRGVIQGLRMRHFYDMGAYMTAAVWQALKPLIILNGPYAFRDALYDLSIVLTNKTPQMAYRGFGVQTTNFALERLVDMAADKLGMSPEEIRFRNFIQPNEFPYRNMTGSIYDSGDYPTTLKKALDLAQYSRFREIQKSERLRGRYLGVGISACLEPGMHNMIYYKLISGTDAEWPTVESATVKVDSEGRVEVIIGFSDSGQGHDTIVRQIVADELHVPFEDIEVVHADSATAPQMSGFHAGSRSAGMLAGALQQATDKIKSKMIEVAACIAGVPSDAVEFHEGVFRSTNGIPLSFREVALAANVSSKLSERKLKPGLQESGVYSVPSSESGPPDLETGVGRGHTTFANSVHISTVEVEIETGIVRLLKHVIVGDCGTQINPAIVEGQQIGGTAQGIGAALYEEFLYDESGQLLTGTYMDYLIPTATVMPEELVVEHLVTPSPFTALGVKGVGEGAIAAAPVAIANAVEDAIRVFGARITKVPMTPEMIYLAVHGIQS